MDPCITVPCVKSQTGLLYTATVTTLVTNSNAFQINFHFDTFLSPVCPRDSLHDETRVARWFVFKPKIPIWVNFGVVIFDIFYGHLVYFMVLWYT
jgi:hypothetical protein